MNDRIYIRKPTSELRIWWYSWEEPVKHVFIDDHSRWTPFHRRLLLDYSNDVLSSKLILTNRPPRSDSHLDAHGLERVVLPPASVAIDAAIATVLGRPPPQAWIVTDRKCYGRPILVAQQVVPGIPDDLSLSTIVDLLLARRGIPYDSIRVSTSRY